MAFQIRSIEPDRLAINARDQCVALAGVDSRVATTTTSSTCSGVIVAGRPGRGSSTNPSRRASANRLRPLTRRRLRHVLLGWATGRRPARRQQPPTTGRHHQPGRRHRVEQPGHTEAAHDRRAASATAGNTSRHRHPQNAAAPRTPDLPSNQPRLDVDRIDPYRDHRCLRALQRGTPQSRQRLSGVSRTHQFLATLTVHTNKINPGGTPGTTSTRSMTNGYQVVVTQRDGQHRAKAHLCDESTARDTGSEGIDPYATANVDRARCACSLAGRVVPTVSDAWQTWPSWAGRRPRCRWCRGGRNRRRGRARRRLRRKAPAATRYARRRCVRDRHGVVAGGLCSGRPWRRGKTPKFNLGVVWCRTRKCAGQAW